VVNNLVGVAYTTGEIAMQSDGTPWRPLVHIEDISRAFLAVLEAPRDAVHNEAFNVGNSSENYQMRDVAAIVQQVVPGSTIRYMEGGGPDPRCYRVDCGKLSRHLPDFKTTWDVRRGARELYEGFVRYGLTREMFANFIRIKRIQELLDAGRLDASLCWQPANVAAV
jgi:nucleoside-diphosphate-sugar epimerase